jgi:carbon storage regulator
MLVLSRRKNESVIINDDITVIVVEVRGDKVRLGIEAPKTMPVHPNEVFEAIMRGRDGDQPNRIREKIDDLHRQIRDLEAELSRLTATEPEA